MKQFLLILLCINCIIISEPTKAADIDYKNTLVATAERNTNGKFGIYIRTKKKQGWLKTVTISVDDKQQLHPSIVQNLQGDIFVAWSRFNGTNGRICTRYYSSDDKKWSSIKVLDSKTTSDIAPTLGIDKKNRVWLAYSGTSDNGDDIYLARWLSGSWSKSEMVNSIDESPDIQPQFIYGSKREILLTWRGFYQGNYINYFSALENDVWTIEKRASSSKINRKEDNHQENLILEITNSLPIASQVAIWDMKSQRPVSITIRNRK